MYLSVVSEAGGWGGDGMGDSSGYGKAPAPSRGGLTNYRARPYWLVAEDF